MGVFIIHVQRFEVVGDGPQPGLHFFCFGTRQEADLLIQPLHAAGGNDAPVALADHGLLNGRSQGQDSFTGAGSTGQVDQVNVRIEQCKQRQALMNVARFQAPGFLVQQRLLVQVE
ncbi:hypothetical protein D3C80_1711850 [compost metagenome]